MKIGMKEDMGIANKMALLVLGSRARSACNCSQSAPERTYLLFMVTTTTCRACNFAQSVPNTLIRSLSWLEVKDCNESRYEGGHGRC